MHGTNIVVLVNLIGKDLDLYDRFRLAIKSDEPSWQHVFIDNSLPFHTETVCFDNLEENQRYTIIGQYCRNNTWFNIKEAIIPCVSGFNEDLNNSALAESNTSLSTRGIQSQEDVFKNTEELHVALKIQPIIVSQHGCAVGDTGNTGDGSGGEDPNPNTDPPNITSQYIIPARPTQQTQNVYDSSRRYLGEANSCVANAIASAKEIQEQRQGKKFLQYSVGWFYGKFGDADIGMYHSSALNGLKNTGIPPYQVVKRIDSKNFYPDCELFSDAQTVVKNTGNISNYTLPQKIASYKRYIANETSDNTITEEICEAIKNTGSGFNTTVLCTITIDKSFDKASNGNGVVGALEGDYRGGHMMIVVGWATIDNKKYWITQNSWTTNEYNMSWTKPKGDNGLMYIPLDWYNVDENNRIWGLEEFYILYDDPNAPELPPINPTTETYLRISSIRPDGKQYPNSVHWYIENLSNKFSTDYYIKAGLTTYQFTQSSSTISGVVSETISQSNETNGFAHGYWNNLQYGTTYKVWGFVQAKNGIYYPMKNGIPVTFETVLGSSFYWSYSGCNLISGKPIAGSNKNSSYGFYVGATEWNRLVQNVKDKLTRRGMYVENTYRLNEATAREGQDFSATKFNLVRRAIGALNSTGLSDKKFGDIISVTELNLLMNKINEVE